MGIAHVFEHCGQRMFEIEFIYFYRKIYIFRQKRLLFPHKCMTTLCRSNSYEVWIISYHYFSCTASNFRWKGVKTNISYLHNRFSKLEGWLTFPMLRAVLFCPRKKNQGRGQSINYVIWKYAIFDPPPCRLFYKVRSILVNRLLGYPLPYRDDKGPFSLPLKILLYSTFPTALHEIWL